MRSNEPPKKVSSAHKRQLLLLNAEHRVNSITSSSNSDSIIVSKNNTKQWVEKLNCSTCQNKVVMRINKQSVFYCDFDILCPTCNNIIGSEVQDVFYVNKNGKVTGYCKRTLGAVYASMLNGKGQKALADFTTGIQGKGLCKSQYHLYKNFICETAEKVVQEHMHVVTARIFEFYKNVLDIHPDKDGILNITVIFDGSWKTRGHDSNLGVGLIIEAHTKTLLDYEAFSRMCHVCANWESRLAKKEISNEEFTEWFADHKCYKNFFESAAAMETAAAVAIWGRSLDKKFRYVNMVSDGDTDAWKAVCSLNLYDVEKFDCIAHVKKRMYRSLNDLTKTKIIETTVFEKNEENQNETKDKKNKTKNKKSAKNCKEVMRKAEETETKKVEERKIVSFTGRDKLSKNTIECIQFYYGHNIRIHDNVQDMQNGIQSIFDHLTSTDDNPKHSKCKDWCFWVQYLKAVDEEKTQRAQEFIKKSDEYNQLSNTTKSFYKRPVLEPFVSKIEKPKHSSMNKRLLFEESSVQYQYIQDVFTRLSDEKLLKRCLDKHNQNPNESFHSRIWSKCPKVQYFTYPMMIFSICQNILIYHLGYEIGNLLRVFDITPTEDMRKHWNTAETSRKKINKPQSKRKPATWSLKKGQENYQKTPRCEEAYKKTYLSGGY